MLPNPPKYVTHVNKLRNCLLVFVKHKPFKHLRVLSGFKLSLSKFKLSFTYKIPKNVSGFFSS